MFDAFSHSPLPKPLSLEEQRLWMVRTQLEQWGIRDERVLHAMRTVPRERFVPQSQQEAAYYDGALPIGEGQTISQPFVVAHMTESLRLSNSDRLLEIGTGSGYQTAILSLLVREVYTIERLAWLSEQAQVTLQEIGCHNIFFRVGDGSLGWPQAAPFDAILVTCAAPSVPPPLIEQLADHGRLVAPVGPRGYQDLVAVRKNGAEVIQERLSPVAFVPLIGEYGW